MGGPDWELQMFEEFDWAQPLAAPEEAPEDPHHPTILEHELHNPVFYAHIVGTIAEFYEIFHTTGAVLLPEATGAAVVAEVLAPLGHAAAIITTFHELYRAFTWDVRIQEHHGYCQGLMLAALRLPDPPTPTTKGGKFEGAGDLKLSEREREAWEEGVRNARAAVAQDPALREEILRAISYEMAVQNRDPSTDPQHEAWHKALGRTLNRLYQRTDDEKLRTGQLDWTGDKDAFPEPPPPQPAPKP